MTRTSVPEQRLRAAVANAEQELRRAQKLHGEFHSPHEGYAVIAEELEELWEDVKAGRVRESLKEAVQVAAMAMRYCIDVGVMVQAKSPKRRKEKVFCALCFAPVVPGEPVMMRGGRGRVVHRRCYDARGS